MTRLLPKSHGTCTIRSEIARGLLVAVAMQPCDEPDKQIQIGFKPVGHLSKTIIWSISRHLDLLQSIPRAIPDRMVQVPWNLAFDRFPPWCPGLIQFRPIRWQVSVLASGSRFRWQVAAVGSGTRFRKQVQVECTSRRYQ